MNEQCLWRRDTELDFIVWQTGCNRSYVFEEGTPAQNNYRFCPWCGRPLKVQEEQDAECTYIELEGFKARRTPENQWEVWDRNDSEWGPANALEMILLDRVSKPPRDEHTRLAEACVGYILSRDPEYSGDMPTWFREHRQEEQDAPV